ncbi:hypothetical protein DSO57_1023045 [Entomophthora muscae]|uniref:Uncharacterized protein n=1 Tax=Entomophthora muscae TaxID=34485 RepID=A0ACC2RHK7_9FUNG|nr:hypothetical protein DSO57_1023045 [Entomophthora muscae]
MKIYSILVLVSNVVGSLERANLNELNSLQELDSSLGVKGVADVVARTAPQKINWQSNRPAPDSRNTPGLQRQAPLTANPGGYNQRYTPFLNTPSTRPQNTGGSNQRYNPPGSRFSPELQRQARLTESPRGFNQRYNPFLNRPYTRPQNPSGSNQRYNPPGSRFSPELQRQAPSTANPGGSNQRNNPFLNRHYTRPQTPRYTSPSEVTRNTGYLPTSNYPSRQTNTANRNQQSNGKCQLLQSNSGRRFETEMNDLYPSIKGQCTEWADGRYYMLTGHHVDFLNGFYDAKFWPARAQANGWQVSSTPSVASIIVLQPQQGEIGETGHVAIVESISGNSICTSNWNFPGRGKLSMKTFDLRALPPSVRYLTHHWGSGRNPGRYNQQGRGYY